MLSVPVGACSVSRVLAPRFGRSGMGQLLSALWLWTNQVVLLLGRTASMLLSRVDGWARRMSQAPAAGPGVTWEHVLACGMSTAGRELLQSKGITAAVAMRLMDALGFSEPRDLQAGGACSQASCQGSSGSGFLHLQNGSAEPYSRGAVRPAGAGCRAQPVGLV